MKNLRFGVRLIFFSVLLIFILYRYCLWFKPLGHTPVIKRTLPRITLKEAAHMILENIQNEADEDDNVSYEGHEVTAI